MEVLKEGKWKTFCLFVVVVVCFFFFLPKKCAQLFLCSLTGNLMYRQLDTCKFLDSIHFNLHVGSLLDQLACGTNMLPEFFLFVYFIYFYFVIPCFRHFKKPLNIFAEFIPQVNWRVHGCISLIIHSRTKQTFDKSHRCLKCKFSWSCSLSSMMA